MRCLLQAALAWGICFAATPLAARPIDCDADVEQPLIGRGFYFSAETPRWQEFIPSHAYVCDVSVVLRVDALRGDLFLRIEDEIGSIVGESHVHETDLALGTGTYVFEFAAGLTPDQLYRLVLSTDEPDVFPAAYFWLGDEDSLYEDGISDVHVGGIVGYDYAFTLSGGSPTGVSGLFTTRPFVLYDAVPNPFNPSTSIAFELRTPSHVRLTVHDGAGRLVITLLDRVCRAGRHEAVWNGRDVRHQRVASGAYLVNIHAGADMASRRVTLVK